MSDMPVRSIRIFGAVMLVPTSMPTWQMMARKQSRTKGLLSKEKDPTQPPLKGDEPAQEVSPLRGDSEGSVIFVPNNSKVASTPTPR